MKKLLILVDLDGICADMVGELIDAYNLEAEEEDEVSIADLTTDELEAWTPLGKDLWKFINKPGWFENLPPLPGAVDSLEKLHDAGHDVVICSSPGNPEFGAHGASEKSRWIRKHLPFLPWRNFILTPLKHICRGDVFIDDSVGKLSNMREAWPSTKLICIAWPYNTGAKCDLRAEGWEDTRKAWETIVEAIERVAQGEEI